MITKAITEPGLLTVYKYAHTHVQSSSQLGRMFFLGHVSLLYNSVEGWLFFCYSSEGCKASGYSSQLSVPALPPFSP